MAKKIINPSINKGAFAQKSISVDALANGILSGDTVALSRAITLIESTKPMDRQDSATLLSHIYPASKKTQSLRIAISGSPGAGKSSFIEALLKDKSDHKFAILTIDPTSSQSHGSILGDKTRMEDLVKKENVFIRPTAAGNTLGGVAEHTREVILLCEAAGYDRIIIETVGVGQSETAVSEMVDLFILLILAGAGDEIQGIKRGIVELADMVLVTKADGDRKTIAKNSVRSYKNALHLFRQKIVGWSIPVIACSSYDNYNLDAIWKHIQNFETFAHKADWLSNHRKIQLSKWYEEAHKTVLLNKILSDKKILASLSEHRDKLGKGEEEIWKLLRELA